MRRTAWLLTGLLLGATGGSVRAEAAPVRVQAAQLLYGVTERLAHLDLLMFIKAESDPVNDLAREITGLADTLQSDLRQLAQAEAFALKPSILPEAEQKARDIGQARARKGLLKSNGARFCREFIKAQYLALSQMQNLAHVLAKNAGSKTQRRSWDEHAERLAELSAEADRIWVEVCPTRD